MLPSTFSLLLSPLFILLSTFSVLLAQEPVFNASVSSPGVYQNSVFSVHFELENAKGADFRAPDFAGFRVMGGPSLGSSTTIINGVMSSSQSWSYSLMAPRTGRFTIGAASVTVGRKTLSTKPLTIEVREVRANTKAETRGLREGDPAIYLRAEVPEGHFYPGQQIRLDYRLVYKDNIQNINTLAEDDYSEFFIQGFAGFGNDVIREMIGDIPFASRSIKSLALFPHQSGTFTIDPMLIRAGINMPYPGGFGLFQMQRIQDVQAVSEPVEITVLPLPPGAPVGFSGAVGRFETGALRPGHPVDADGAVKIAAGEAFTFQVEITGNGDMRRWDLPACVTDGDFELYAPKVDEEKVSNTGREITCTRLLTYRLIPGKPGAYHVFVPFTYFDTEQEKYVTISGDTLLLMVLPGADRRQEVAADSTGAVEKLMPVRKALLPDRFWASPLHLILFGLILLGAGSGAAVTIRRKREARIPEQERKKREAGRLARERLDELERRKDALPSKDFFEGATEVYYTFLTDRFGIPAGELDESKLPGFLAGKGAGDEAVSRAVRFFHQSLAVRYGGIPGGFTREEMVKECREVMEGLEL